MTVRQSGKKVSKAIATSADWAPRELSSFFFEPDIGTMFDEQPVENNGSTIFGNHSWYFRVMTRDRFRVFHKPRAFHGCVAPSWTAGMNGEWLNSLVILRPFVTESGIVEFVSRCRSIAHSMRKPLLLKQVHRKLAARLVEGGCRPYKSAERWNPQYRYDEQDHPEVLAELQTMTNLEPRALLHHLNRQTRKAYGRFEVVEAFPTAGDQWRDSLIDVFWKWRSQFLRRHKNPELTNYEFVGWNLAAIKGISLGPTERLFLAHDQADASAVAFCHLTRSNAVQWDMAMSFCCSRVNDLHRLLYLKVLQRMSQEGWLYVNFGGSEEHGLYTAKKKIWKFSEIHTTHLVVDPR